MCGGGHGHYGWGSLQVRDFLSPLGCWGWNLALLFPFCWFPCALREPRTRRGINQPINLSTSQLIISVKQLFISTILATISMTCMFRPLRKHTCAFFFEGPLLSFLLAVFPLGCDGEPIHQQIISPHQRVEVPKPLQATADILAQSH